MYFPKLIDLIVDKRFTKYNGELITKIDDYLGRLSEGVTFKEDDFNIIFNNVLLTDKVLSDLCQLGIIEENLEPQFGEVDDENEENRSFNLLVAPNKINDPKYNEYLKKKRQIDSFSIIYDKTQRKKSGALTLIDLKGYSKNVNNNENNTVVLLLISKIQKAIDDALNQYFLNSYSGIEIKHNGDGWFLYFLVENEAYEFLLKVMHKIMNEASIYNDFKNLGTSLKCYIHHSKEIEKIYKVDTLHFDMEGKDVILIHMLEKPIEKVLYENVIENSSNFIAITEDVLAMINKEYGANFSPLSNLTIDTKDTEGNIKVARTDIKVYYQEFKSGI